MSFIRPEVAALLYRWREVLILGALALIGVYIALKPGFFLAVAGWALLAFSFLMIPVAFRRARFNPGDDGIGVVRLREKRVVYMGPEGGGTVSLDDLDHLVLVVERTGRHWRLVEGPQRLDIPVDAVGADQLFDAFTQLNGLSSGQLLDALESLTPGEITLWTAPRHPGLTLS